MLHAARHVAVESDVSCGGIGGDISDTPVKASDTYRQVILPARAPLDCVGAP
jgi:hypothetical protein